MTNRGEWQWDMTDNGEWQIGVNDNGIWQTMVNDILLCMIYNVGWYNGYERQLLMIVFLIAV